MMRTVTHAVRVLGIVLALLAVVAPRPVTAQQLPDFTRFGYPTVVGSVLAAPNETVSLSVGPQTVTIRPGTFDSTVVFDLLVDSPSAWQPLVQGRTVRAAFAFRVRDAATGNFIGVFKQPVLYAYTGSDAQATDTILDTSAATPAAITANPVPITFDGKVNHPFRIATVGWLTVSAPTA